MEKWNEIRTAYKLAKAGTLSAAADEMGIHRSTVMRHIDALEEHLGVVLFQRNDKGYIPTEAGLEIMRLGEVTDNHFSRVSSQLRSKEEVLEGVLTITMVNEMAPMLMPVIREYRNQYPGMRVNLIGDLRNFNLEYGEADIAIRAGDKPITPDNIVFELTEAEVVLAAHEDYIAQHGLPDQKVFSGKPSEHYFLALNQRPEHLLWNEWIHKNIPEQNIAIQGSSQNIVSLGILTGVGIGAITKDTLEEYPELQENPDRNELDHIGVGAGAQRYAFYA